MAFVTEIEIYKGVKITHEKNEYHNSNGRSTLGIVRITYCGNQFSVNPKSGLEGAIKRAKEFIDKIKP